MYTILNVFPFDYTAFAVSGQVGIPLTGLAKPMKYILSEETLTVIAPFNVQKY